jgi:N-acetylglucosaminyldiphosphoundecaprenol N-acetyl-beta-D-mannosaminyltransferase
VSAETVASPASARHTILSCPVDALTFEQTVERVVEVMRRGGCHSQFSLNAAKVVEAHRDAELREFLLRATIVSADGQSLVWAGKLLGVPLPERVAGIDLLIGLLAAFEQEGFSAYFLGSREPVIARAVERIAALYPSLRIAGFHHGHFSPADDEQVAAEIRDAAPDALFVGMSSPRKEYWIDTYQAQTGAGFAMGVGGSFDVLAGVRRRAPAPVQRLGLEWAFRTAQEPRRLLGRYVRTNAVFAGLVSREVLRSLRRGGGRRR